MCLNSNLNEYELEIVNDPLSKYEYTFYEIDLDLFENGTFFTTTMKNGETLFEVPIRYFCPLIANIANLI